MNNMQNNQKFIQLLIILLALFIFIFFTKLYYGDLIGNLDINDEKNKIYQEKLDEANYLSKRQKELKKAKQGTQKTKEYEEIKKYLEPISEDKIIEEIYGNMPNAINAKVEVLSLTMGKGVKNELGFMESKLNISLLTTDKSGVKDIFDYLTKESKYKIFINSFNMPKQNSIGAYKIQIPATIFYVDAK